MYPMLQICLLTRLHTLYQQATMGDTAQLEAYEVEHSSNPCLHKCLVYVHLLLYNDPFL